MQKNLSLNYKKKGVDMVSVDFDSVLYDLEIVLLNELKDLYGKEIKDLMEIDSWDYYKKFPRVIECFSDFERYSKGRAKEGAKEFLSSLKNMVGEKNVQIVTASPEPIVEKKNKMILDMFGDIKVIHSFQKPKYTKGTVLIDDAVHNVLDHYQQTGSPAILFDPGYGWNQEPVEKTNKGIVRCGSYEESLKELKNIKKKGLLHANKFIFGNQKK